MYLYVHIWKEANFEVDLGRRLEATASGHEAR